MQVDGRHYRTIWLDPDDQRVVRIIDQQRLPHEFVIKDLQTVEVCRAAIADMHVRGAGLIGATAGYGMYIAALEADSKDFDTCLEKSAAVLVATRPTASNRALTTSSIATLVKGVVS